MTFKVLMGWMEFLLFLLTPAILYTIIFFFLEKRPHKKTYKRLFMHYGFFIGLFIFSLFSYNFDFFKLSSNFFIFLFFYFYYFIIFFIIYYLLFIIYYLLFKKYFTINGLFFFLLIILFLTMGLFPMALAMGLYGISIIIYLAFLVEACILLFFAIIFMKIYHSFKNQQPQNKDKPNEL